MAPKLSKMLHPFIKRQTKRCLGKCLASFWPRNSWEEHKSGRLSPFGQRRATVRSHSFQFLSESQRLAPVACCAQPKAKRYSECYWCEHLPAHFPILLGCPYPAFKRSFPTYCTGKFRPASSTPCPLFSAASSNPVPHSNRTHAEALPAPPFVPLCTVYKMPGFCTNCSEPSEPLVDCKGTYHSNVVYNNHKLLNE